jgi:hypothetical protein
VGGPAAQISMISKECVVLHSLDVRRHTVALELEQGEGGPEIAVLGLAHRTAVDEQDAALLADPWLMGVPEDQHVAVSAGRDALERPGWLGFEQVFVDLARRPMHEPHALVP